MHRCVLVSLFRCLGREGQPCKVATGTPRGQWEVEQGERTGRMGRWGTGSPMGGPGKKEKPRSGLWIITPGPVPNLAAQICATEIRGAASSSPIKASAPHPGKGNFPSPPCWIWGRHDSLSSPGFGVCLEREREILSKDEYSRQR